MASSTSHSSSAIQSALITQALSSPSVFESDTSADFTDNEFTWSSLSQADDPATTCCERTQSTVTGLDTSEQPMTTAAANTLNTSHQTTENTNNPIPASHYIGATTIEAAENLVRGEAGQFVLYHETPSEPVIRLRQLRELVPLCLPLCVVQSGYGNPHRLHHYHILQQANLMSNARSYETFTLTGFNGRETLRAYSLVDMVQQLNGGERS